MRKMLKGSSAVVSVERVKRLVGFGRAPSDGTYRALLWDVVIPEDLHGKAIGRHLVEALVFHQHIRHVEQISLMTTKRSDFYQQLEFKTMPSHRLTSRIRIDSVAKQKKTRTRRPRRSIEEMS